jgi:hypothetical protein
VLEALRTEEDPVPDRIVTELATSGETDAVHQVLRHLIQNGQPIPEELPDNIEFWLRETAALPAWAEPDRLERGVPICQEDLLGTLMIFSYVVIRISPGRSQTPKR